MVKCKGVHLIFAATSLILTFVAQAAEPSQGAMLCRDNRGIHSDFVPTRLGDAGLPACLDQDQPPCDCYYDLCFPLVETLLDQLSTNTAHTALVELTRDDWQAIFNCLSSSRLGLVRMSNLSGRPGPHLSAIWFHVYQALGLNEPDQLLRQPLLDQFYHGLINADPALRLSYLSVVRQFPIQESYLRPLREAILRETTGLPCLLASHPDPCAGGLPRPLSTGVNQNCLTIQETFLSDVSLDANQPLEALTIQAGFELDHEREPVHHVYLGILAQMLGRPTPSNYNYASLIQKYEENPDSAWIANLAPLVLQWIPNPVHVCGRDPDESRKDECPGNFEPFHLVYRPFFDRRQFMDLYGRWSGQGDTYHSPFIEMFKLGVHMERLRLLRLLSERFPPSSLETLSAAGLEILLLGRIEQEPDGALPWLRLEPRRSFAGVLSLLDHSSERIRLLAHTKLMQWLAANQLDSNQTQLMLRRWLRGELWRDLGLVDENATYVRSQLVAEIARTRELCASVPDTADPPGSLIPDIFGQAMSLPPTFSGVPAILRADIQDLPNLGMNVCGLADVEADP